MYSCLGAERFPNVFMIMTRKISGCMVDILDTGLKPWLYGRIVTSPHDKGFFPSSCLASGNGVGSTTSGPNISCKRKVIKNASRPRRPHLWIRVLVCLGEAFVKQGKYELTSIGIWSQLINIGPNCHQHGTPIQPTQYTNHTLGHPRFCYLSIFLHTFLHVLYECFQCFQ